MSRLLASLCAVLLFTGTARAHSPIPAVGAFYNGMLHPLITPSHALVLLAIGLLCGQHAPRVSRPALPAFAALLALGLAWPLPLPALAADTATALLVLAAIAGVCVALGGAWRGLAALMAACAGLAVGLDTRADAGPALTSADGAGIWLGAVLAVTLVGGLSAPLRRTWQRIGVRALGSWIAAASLLVLTLTFATSAGAG